jgi:hypothetical protein
VIRALALAALAVIGCGGGSNPSTPTPDLSVKAPDMTAFKSDCGFPGDQGNSLGVGKFCTAQTFVADCGMNSKANLCANLGSDTDFFCTFACSSTGAADQCGENARCACQGGQCGCFPTRCDNGPPPDMSSHD